MIDIDRIDAHHDIRVNLSFVFVFNDFRRAVVVCFFDVGRIDDHHCLSFLFIMCFVYSIHKAG